MCVLAPVDKLGKEVSFSSLLVQGLIDCNRGCQVNRVQHCSSYLHTFLARKIGALNSVPCCDLAPPQPFCAKSATGKPVHHCTSFFSLIMLHQLSDNSPFRIYDKRDSLTQTINLQQKLCLPVLPLINILLPQKLVIGCLLPTSRHGRRKL